MASFKSSDALSVFRPNVNFLQLTQPVIYTKQKHSPTASTLEGDIDTLSRTNTTFSWVSGVIYAHPNSWFSYKGHGVDHLGTGVQNYASETQNTKFRVEVEIHKICQGGDVMSNWTNTEPSVSIPFDTIRPTLQILTVILLLQITSSRIVLNTLIMTL